MRLHGSNSLQRRLRSALVMTANTQMDGVLTEVFKRYGVIAILAAIALGATIWLVAHLSAAPGTQISLLWGLASYTKSPSVPSQAAPPRSDVAPTFLPPSVPATTPLALRPVEVFQKVAQSAGQAQLEDLRKREALRELSEFEGGKRITETPPGTYFFTLAVFIDRDEKESYSQLERGPAYRFPPSPFGTLELHRNKAAQMSAVVFTTDGDAARVAAMSAGSDCIVSAARTDQFQTLVYLPLERIVTARARRSELTNRNTIVLIDLRLR